jgi:hypothetical protein
MQRKNKHAVKYPNERTNMKAKENKQKACRIRRRFRTMPRLLIPHKRASSYEYADRLIHFVVDAKKKHREPNMCSVLRVQATPHTCRDSWSTTRCVTSKFIKSVYSAFNKCYVEIRVLIVTVELLALLRIREVTGSNLGSKTNYVE